MQENFLVFTVIAVIAIILISLVIVFINLKKDAAIQISQKKHDEEIQKKITIEAMVELVAKRNTSKNDITLAILEVAKSCPFPPKTKGISPKNAKMYLNFILLVASHKNVDAKLIAFMDEQLKKTNPEYKTEIDIYESEGIHQRGNRV